MMDSSVKERQDLSLAQCGRNVTDKCSFCVEHAPPERARTFTHTNTEHFSSEQSPAEGCISMQLDSPLLLVGTQVT